MTKSLLTTSLLISVFALSACSQSSFTNDSFEVPAEDSSASSGIVGGTKVEANDEIAKTTVQIYTLQTEKDYFGNERMVGIAGCTGSILAENIVLTAAHCTAEKPEYIFLYFGTQAADLKTLKMNDPRIRRVVGGKVGSNWAKLTANQLVDNGDIALLRFDGGLPEGFQLAQLLPKEHVLKAQQPVTLAGFGLTDGVRNVRSDKLLKVNITILEPAFSKTEMIVDSGEGKGPCHGDSGGPAYVTVNGKSYVAGATSRAESKTDPLGKCIGDTVYTKVQPYLTWIKSSMRVLQSPTFKPQPIPQPRGY